MLELMCYNWNHKQIQVPFCVTNCIHSNQLFYVDLLTPPLPRSRVIRYLQLQWTYDKILSHIRLILELDIHLPKLSSLRCQNYTHTLSLLLHYPIRFHIMVYEVDIHYVLYRRFVSHGSRIL